MLKGKRLLDYTRFPPDDYQKNDIFLITKKMKKLYCVICGKYIKFE